jgi:hypothetical protein
MEKRSNIMNPEMMQEHSGKGIREVPQEIIEWTRNQKVWKTPQGTVITDVAERSPGAVAGLKKGDMVLSLDDEPVFPQTFSQQLQFGADEVKTLLVRGEDGSSREVLITPGWNVQVKRWVIGVVLSHELREDLSIPEGEKQRRIPFELDVGSVGKVRGYAEISKSDSARVSAMVLSRYVLFFTGEDGRPMEVDLLQRWKQFDVPCMVDSNLPSSGGYFPSSKRVSTKTLFSTFTPHVLAHEYRHVYQYHSSMPIRGLYFPTQKRTYDEAFLTKKVRLGGCVLLAQSLLGGGIFEEMEEAEFYIKAVKHRFDRYHEARRVFEELAFGESGVEKKLQIEAAKEIKPFLREGVWNTFVDHVNSRGISTLSFGEVRVEFYGVDSQELENRQQKDCLRNLKKFVGNDAFPNTASFIIKWNQAFVDFSTNSLVLSQPSLKLRLEVPLKNGVSQKVVEVIQNLQETARSTMDNYRSKLNLASQETKTAYESLPDVNTEVVEGLTVLDILRLPTLRMERDAEYGALVALRSLEKDTGIDFLAPGEKTEVMINEGPEFSPSLTTDQRISSIQQIHSNIASIGVSIPCVRKFVAKVRKQRKEKEGK